MWEKKITCRRRCTAPPACDSWSSPRRCISWPPQHLYWPWSAWSGRCGGRRGPRPGTGRPLCPANTGCSSVIEPDLNFNNFLETWDTYFIISMLVAIIPGWTIKLLVQHQHRSSAMSSKNSTEYTRMYFFCTNNVLVASSLHYY